ncbi:type II CAAX prenyl endopeptidase Rce1 family protein [Streptomyces sp. NPDC087568]
MGIVAFALVNAVWEEVLFRGVLLTETAASWSPTACAWPPMPSPGHSRC